MQNELIPHPGIAIIIPLDEESTSNFTLTQKSQGRITRGKIIAMGPDDKSVYGAIFRAEDYGEVGDIVYFLHYYDEGGVDQTTIGNQKYFFVKFGDLRARGRADNEYHN